MAANNEKEGDVEREVIKGEEDEVLDDYPKPAKARPQEKPRPKPSAVKRDVCKQPDPQFASLRTEELARPKKHHVLITLCEKAPILPPQFVDNLIRIIEAESSLTPEEAAQILRERKKRRKKVTRPPVCTKKLDKKIAKIDAIEMFEKDATICQYLIAECFVKSILGYQCQSQKKDIRDIAEVILKRLTSLDVDTHIQTDDRATQQLHLLADIVACWIAEILMDVAENRKEAVEEYCEKRRMKMMEVEEDNDDQINDKELKDWKLEKEEVTDIKEEVTDIKEEEEIIEKEEDTIEVIEEEEIIEKEKEETIEE